MRSHWILLGIIISIITIIGCQTGAVQTSATLFTNGSDESANSPKLILTQPVDESIVRSNPVTVSGNTSSDADVMINGVFVGKENGHFSELIELEPGPNMIEVIARDPSGKQASEYITVVYVP